MVARLKSLIDRHSRWVLLPFAVMAVGLLVVPLPGTAQATTRHINLDATQFQFAPERVQVNKGDRVVLTLTASDVVHGFYLDGYGLEQRIVPGVAQQVVFVADKAGKFRYRCAVSCGPLHPFMIGELVVNSNTPYWRAIGLVLVMTAGMLVYLWQTGKNKSMGYPDAGH
jgi:heme/copper-type cytochrome/quinol oxidase subunit 2